MKTIITKIALIIVLVSASINATNYYLSNSGNDSNSGITPSSPWKSLSKLNSIVLKPGDNVCFKKGDSWNSNWTISNSGTENNPIYIKSYGEGLKPVLDGASTLQYLIQLNMDVSYIIFDDLFLKDCNPQYSGGPRSLIYGRSNNRNIIIKNCTFRQKVISTSSDYAAIYAKDPSYFTIDSCDFSGGCQMIHFQSNNTNHRDVHHINITNNYFHDMNARLYNNKTYDGQFGLAIKMSMSYPAGIGNVLGQEGIVRDINISGNRFYKLSGNAIWHEDTRNTQEKTSEYPQGVPIWLVAGKTSYNINVTNNYAKLVEWGFIDWGRITDRGGLFPWSNCSSNIIDSCGFDISGNPTTNYPTNAINTHAWKQVYIENNIISNVATNSGDGKGIILDYSSDSKKFICDSVVVRNNIVSGTGVNSKLNYAAAIHLSSAERCSVYNNICYDNKAGICVESSTSTDNFICNNTMDGNIYGFWFGSPAVRTILKNNAITNNKTYGIKNNTNLIYDYNGFHNNGKDYSSGQQGNNDVFGNPHYLNLSKYNYELDSNSAFIDQGTNIGISKDIMNNPRTNSIDIGAYEFSKNTQDNQKVYVNIKIFLQGPYSNGSMLTSYRNEGLIPFIDPYLKSLTVKSLPENIVDWIYIELRSSKFANSKVAQRSAFLRSDGMIVDIDGKSMVAINNITPGNYYIVIKHRNHLSVMTRNPIYISLTSRLFDFTLTPDSAYGTNALVKLENGVYGMYSGDGDGNGIININDYNSVSNNIFKSGYNSGDLDLNSIINVLDYSKSCKNLLKSSQVPN